MLETATTANISTVGRFWNLLSLYKLELRQIYAYAVFNGIVNLTLPLGIQAIINYIQTGEMTSSWVVLVCFVLIGIAITGVLQVLQLRIVENIQQDLFTRSAFEFAYRIPKITFFQLDRIHAPELANRFFDTITIQKGLPKILIDFSLAVFQIVFGLVLLTVYSPYFIILGLALILILFLIFKITGPKGLQTSLKESKSKYQLVHWLEEIARSNRSFKLYADSKFHLNKTDEIASQYLKYRENHFRVLINQFRWFIGFKVFVAAGLLLLGGYLVFQEQLDIGQFVAAEIIIILIINSVEKVIRIIDSIYDVLTALEKIGYVTDLKLDSSAGIARLDSEEGLLIQARELVFGFPDDSKNVIDDLSFDIKSNEKVVLEGKSGSGKTSLLQILAGIHTIQDGELRINGIPYESYSRDTLYAQLGVAFPTNQIFEGSFRENITIGRDIKDDEVNDIVKILGLDNYIIHQPQGLNTIVDSGGRRLPRSIIQKIMIARMIIHEPKLILMEDPLQFIELAQKKKIVDYIMHPDRKWTCIVITDFPYWKEKATQTITLKRQQR